MTVSYFEEKRFQGKRMRLTSCAFRDNKNGFKILGPAIYSQADPLTEGLKQVNRTGSPQGFKKKKKKKKKWKMRWGREKKTSWSSHNINICKVTVT